MEGSAATPEAVAAAGERGVDISAHLGRRLVRELVLDADLVLTMAGEHRDRVMVMVPEAEPRTFTLKELVRLLEQLPPADPRVDPERSLRERVAQAVDLRRSGFAGNPFDEDVTDPLGLPVEAYRAVAWELDEWGSRLVAGLLGTDARAGLRTAEG